MIMGDPKTKFLRIFLSAHKKLLLTLPLSDVRPRANPIKWGQSYTDVYTLGQNSLPNSLGQI